jgi:type IV fimbrial biogenesis protein FimT
MNIYKRHGFSIVELMITIFVAAILMGLALPSFRELTIRSNITQANNQLVLALNTARSEAVRRGTWVEVVNTTSSTNKWTAGWQIIADTNFSQTFTSDPIVALQGGVPTGYSVCGNATGATGIGGNWTVIFNASGALTQSTSFDINVNRPDGNKTQAARITVLGSGEVTSRKDTTGSPASFSCP